MIDCLTGGYLGSTKCIKRVGGGPGGRCKKGRPTVHLKVSVWSSLISYPDLILSYAGHGRSGYEIRSNLVPKTFFNGTQETWGRRWSRRSYMKSVNSLRNLLVAFLLSHKSHHYPRARLAYSRTQNFHEREARAVDFLCFLWQKRARERELDLFPLQKIASSDVILARTICVPVACVVASRLW